MIAWILALLMGVIAARSDDYYVSTNYTVIGNQTVIRVHVALQPGFHVLSKRQDPELGTPAEFKFEHQVAVVEATVPYEDDGSLYLGEPKGSTSIGDVVWFIWLDRVVDNPAGTGTIQICSDSCEVLDLVLEPTRADFAVVADFTPPTPEPFWPYIFYGLAGGLILNVMPCVLPILSLKVFQVSKMGGQSRATLIKSQVLYVAGILTVFAVLATLAAFAGMAWGELFTYPAFKLVMAVILVAMGASYLGLWHMPQWGKWTENDYLKGVFATLMATPCSGPFLGVLFAYTLTATPVVTYILFLSVGVGMASPHLLLALFPQIGRLVPKPGAWMLVFQQVLGFVMFATAIYVLSLTGPYGQALAKMFAGGLTLWFWVFLMWKHAGSELGPKMVGFLGAAATLVCLLGVIPGTVFVKWVEWDEHVVQDTVQRDQTAVLVFTADWCPTCKINLKTAIDTEAIAVYTEAENIKMIRADYTNRNDGIKAVLKGLGRNSIPLVVVYPADGSEPIILDDVITATEFRQALETAVQRGK